MISNFKKCNDNRVISYLSDMRFSEDTYKRLKIIIHPKIRKKIHNFKIDSYCLSPLP